MKLYSYNRFSESALALSKALGVKRVRHHGDRIISKQVILNWGATQFNRNIVDCQIINANASIAIASNKLSAFKALSNGVVCPKWTESREEASEWLKDDIIVVCRTILNGHSGNGIVIAAKADELVEAPLYTQYIKKSQEYRLHVHKDSVFFIQRKARDKEIPDDQVNWQIRNHHNGFIYAHKDVDLPDEVKEQAITACKLLNLDFGAVDLILGMDDSYYVLEVNTAPGLAGTTLDKYVEQFRQYL